jgi:hypothetical protein
MTVLSMRRTKRSFVPALLLSLVIGAALVAQYLGTAADSPAGGDWAASGGATPTTHHPAANGLVAVGTPGEVANATHHGGDNRSVAERLRDRPTDVKFCVGASLEPFAPSLAQMAAIGTDEAAERTRRCMMELIFTHVDQATATAVRAELPMFSDCYRRSLAMPNPTKSEAVSSVTNCLVGTTARAR